MDVPRLRAARGRCFILLKAADCHRAVADPPYDGVMQTRQYRRATVGAGQVDVDHAAAENAIMLFEQAEPADVHCLAGDGAMPRERPAVFEKLSDANKHGVTKPAAGSAIRRQAALPQLLSRTAQYPAPRASA